jgi:hypothetical protein
LLTALVVTPWLAVAAGLQAPGDPSSARGDALVLAQGVVALGANELVWTAARRTAPPPANATPVDATNGFLLAADGVVLVADTATGKQTRLAAGEAMLTHTGENQVRAALGPNEAGYYAIELVDAAAATPGADAEVFHIGDAMPGPSASHDLDLVGDILLPGEVAEVGPGAGQTLVLVSAGAATVTTEEGGIYPVEAGNAVTFFGVLSITAGDAGATMVAAVIGPVVPALTGPEATARAATPEPTATPTVAAGETPAATTTAPTPDDPDGDGLTDTQELEYNTDPGLADTDGDGLSDGAEVNTHKTAPLARDTDGDGILDGDEVAQGSDPNDATSVSGSGSDGGTTGTADDTDGDGFLDVDELNLGSDPNDPDTDDDGATDGNEYFVLATGVLNPDTDADGVLDGTEAANGTDPNDPNSY